MRLELRLALFNMGPGWDLVKGMKGMLRFFLWLVLLQLSASQLSAPVFELTGSLYDAGTIQLQTLVHANVETVPLLYVSKTGSPVLASEHPCAISPTICCLNDFIVDYTTAPGVQELAEHPDLCTAAGVETLGGSGNSSLDTVILNTHLFPHSIENTDFLSDASGVTTSMTGTAESGYTIVVGFPLDYLRNNSVSEVLGGGVTRYEFATGAVFVRLFSVVPAVVSIDVVQVNIRFFMQDYTLISVSSEQTRVFVDQVQTSLHQVRDAETLAPLQYLKFWFAYDRTTYPGSPEIMLDTVRVATGSSSSALSWQGSCGVSGYYTTGDAVWRGQMDGLANLTCLPHEPSFCSVGQFENFWLPLPEQYVSSAEGFLFVNFVLKLQDSGGYEHLSNLYFSLDLSHWGLIEHCTTESVEVGLDHLISVTTSVGVLPQNESGTELVRRTVIGGTLDSVKGRRLLQTGACAAPICAAGSGVDELGVCEGGVVRCTECDGEDSVIKLRHNASVFQCVRDTCLVREGSGELKRWGRAGDGVESAYQFWGLLESGTAVGVGRETGQVFLNDTATFTLLGTGESAIHFASSEEQFVVLSSWNRVFLCSESACAEEPLPRFSEVTQVVSAPAGFWVVFADGETMRIGSASECVDAGSTASSPGVLNLAVASQISLYGGTIEYDAVYVKSYEEV